MAAPPSTADQPRLSFAKVAASTKAQSSPVQLSALSSVPHAEQIIDASEQLHCNNNALQDGESNHTTNSLMQSPEAPTPAIDITIVGHDAETKEKESTLANALSTIASSREPVSEENITKITSLQSEKKPTSLDGKSVASATTFTLDEKESLRPDDSASVKATDDEDGRASTQAGSRFGSDSGARAFSDQLREISNMGHASRQRIPIPSMGPVVPPGGSTLCSPSPLAGSNSFPDISTPEATIDDATLAFPPDEKLLEALTSIRDRVWVLKLEQDITDFVKDENATSFDLPQCNSFYRMLAHKMADYYLLGHIMDGQTVRLWKTPNSRIPPRLSTLTDPITANSTPPPTAPQMKILRRGGNDTRPGSADGGLISRDVDGDSGSDSGKPKAPATLEERAARYEAARLRILGSAKPSEDPAGAEKKEESRSSSATGKKKTKKQRSDSEDGFEARSAYNTFSNSTMQNSAMSSNGQYFLTPQQPESKPFNALPYAQGEPYGRDYQSMMNAQMGQFPFYQQGYQGSSEQSSQQWQSSSYGNYGGYDLSGQFQQSMSFQQPQQHQQTQQQPSAQGSYAGLANASMHNANGAPISPGQWPPPQSPSQNHNPQYSNFSSQPPAQSYAYGVLPNQMFPSGKRQNPNHPLPGSFNRQPQFNPQSQTFTPGGPSSPSMQPPYLTNYGPPYTTPQTLQRQHSSQYQGPSYAATFTGQPGHAGGGLPSAQGLTHPLPQPVFSQSLPQTPRQASEQPAQIGIYQNHKIGPSAQNGPPGSSIAKFSGASLPAKPPPPADNAFHMSSGINQSSRSSSYGNGPHPLPSVSNFSGRGA